ncbi:phage portal protein [Weissella minor]|uniref:phage portal protein n=1 Tax=Weissella minor TaxID=1620 RepID=UPI001BAFC8A5|nr:phage portal protein [Weissella minor]MBS0950047.1 phage portal protein [Weissella minor]
MPLFNVLASGTKNELKPLQGINGDDDVLNFLNPQASSYISAKEALRNSDIYAVIMRLSSDLALSHLETDNPSVQSLLDAPTPITNSMAFWQSMYAQLLLGGEAFAYRWRNRNGRDVRLEYLRPSQVSTYMLSDGSGLIYDVTFDEPNIGLVQAIPSADIIHFRLLSTNGGKTGMSPLYALSNELGIKKSSDRLTKTALDQSVLAPGILQVKAGGLANGENKRDRSKTFMKQLNSQGPIVIDELEEYTPLEIKSDISKLLAQADWTREQIAKVYGVDDSVLGGKGDEQSSVNMLMEQYMRSLNRFSTPIESELSNKFKASINANLSEVSDLLKTTLVKQAIEMMKEGGLTSNEFKYLLKERGYLSQDFPDIAETNPRFLKKGGSE